MTNERDSARNATRELAALLRDEYDLYRSANLSPLHALVEDHGPALADVARWVRIYPNEVEDYHGIGPTIAESLVEWADDYLDHPGVEDTLELRDRGDIQEDTKYRSPVNIRRIIWRLREGDRVRTTQALQDEPQYVVRVTDWMEEGSGVVEEGPGYVGDEVLLLPAYYGSQGQGHGQPWLRTRADWKSLGEIWALEVLELADVDGTE